MQVSDLFVCVRLCDLASDPPHRRSTAVYCVLVCPSSFAITRDYWLRNELLRTGVGIVCRHTLLCWTVVECRPRNQLMQRPARYDAR
jgi:hypothetical protein